MGLRRVRIEPERGFGLTAGRNEVVVSSWRDVGALEERETESRSEERLRAVLVEATLGKGDRALHAVDRSAISG